MPKFRTRIRKVRFISSGYSGREMAAVGDGLITRGIIPRILAATTTTDSPAKPLSARYARGKAKIHPPGIRNWSFTGRTLRSMKVLTAQKNKAVIGFTDAESNKRAAINNRISRQFGVSPRDKVILGDQFEKLPPPVQATYINEKAGIWQPYFA